MHNLTLAMWTSVITAVLVAAMVTIVNRSTAGKLIGYLACAIFAVGPLFGRYAVIVFAVAGLVMAGGVIIVRRRMS